MLPARESPLDLHRVEVVAIQCHPTFLSLTYLSKSTKRINMMMKQASLLLTALLASVAVAVDGSEVEQVPWGGRDYDPEDQGIIGGDNVMPGALPFYGHFQGTTMCGGALIHEDIFVTAAHCLEKGFRCTVRIGATTTTSSYISSISTSTSSAPLFCSTTFSVVVVSFIGVACATGIGCCC